MQPNYKLVVWLSLLCLGCDSPADAGPDESKEPPSTFVVTVGQESVVIKEGETAQLDGQFTNPSVSVTPQAYRVFPYAGIKFKYPRSFTFEADLSDPNSKSWTLSGNDLKIMIFVLNSRLTTADFANNMMEQFGGENCQVVDANASLAMGKQTLSGTTIHVSVATFKMAMDIYLVPSRGPATKLLVIQDSLDDAGNRSKEGKQTLEELSSSFTWSDEIASF
jgi:hypothetical protein